MSTDPEKQEVPPTYEPEQQQAAYPSLPADTQPAQAYPPPQAEVYPPPQAEVYPPPQAQAYPPQQQPTQTVTVVTAPPVITQQTIVFRDVPVTMTDANGQQFVTELDYRNGLLVWIAVAVTCLFTLGLLLCCLGLIPLCINSLKDVYHLNPTTKEVVGIYKRMG